MTRDEAIRTACAVAETEGWPWQTPVSATLCRAFLFFGRRQWLVRSNVDYRGGNVNVRIDDLTGEILGKAFATR